MSSRLVTIDVDISVEVSDAITTQLPVQYHQEQAAKTRILTAVTLSGSMPEMRI